MPEIIARDPAMLAVLRRVEQAAASALPVLVIGESGTGKALVAAHLHRASGGDPGTACVLDCATLTEAQLEAGFGEPDCPRALTLRDLGEMEPGIQARALRLIRQHEAERLRPGRAGIRLLATATPEIHDHVRNGRFRADLFFRLNVIEIRLPPLRHRPADIPALADHFARKFTLAPSPATLTDPALALLMRHTWPGNVRELANVIHRAVLTEPGAPITPAALGIEAPDAPTTPPETVCTSGRTIEAVEKDMILDRLLQCRGNRALTAATLGISIRTLRNKLNEYQRDGTRIPRPIVVAVA